MGQEGVSGRREGPIIPCPGERVQTGCGQGAASTVGVGGTDETLGTRATSGIEVTLGMVGTVGTLGTGRVAFGGVEREGWWVVV